MVHREMAPALPAYPMAVGEASTVRERAPATVGPGGYSPRHAAIRPACRGSGLSLRDLDLDLEHLEIVLAFQAHAQVLVADLHVLGNHRDQLALQGGEVIGRRG